MINRGKQFENAIKKSIPDYCLYYRLPDPPQSFNQNSSLRFSWKNPCDCFIFNSYSSILYTLELKTTKNTSISFEDIENKDIKTSKMIHRHQIISLCDFSKFNKVCSGFLFNFRSETENIEKTYFQEINDFLLMISNINKKSFNEKDLFSYSSIKIDGKKKIKYWTWDIDGFMKKEIQ